MKFCVQDRTVLYCVHELTSFTRPANVMRDNILLKCIDDFSTTPITGELLQVVAAGKVELFFSEPIAIGRFPMSLGLLHTLKHVDNTIRT